jgi:hypothetical protein
MITAIISTAYANGAEMWLIGWLACMLLYFAVLILFRRNRTKNGVKNILLCFLSAEFIVDLAWSLIYYDRAGYVNHGLAAVYWLLLWPAALLVSGILASKLNKSSLEYYPF